MLICLCYIWPRAKYRGTHGADSSRLLMHIVVTVLMTRPLLSWALPATYICPHAHPEIIDNSKPTTSLDCGEIRNDSCPVSASLVEDECSLLEAL